MILINVFTNTILFPTEASEELIYYAMSNNGIFTGYWTGLLYLAYEVSGDKRFLSAAETQVDSFKNRLDKD